jgi:tuberous sclerosis protein 2
MEMQEAMTKSLPETLLSLSKISATVALSIPKLEFLSSILNLDLIFLKFFFKFFKKFF